MLGGAQCVEYTLANTQRWELWKAFHLWLRCLHLGRDVCYLLELSDFLFFVEIMMSSIMEDDHFGCSMEDNMMQYAQSTQWNVTLYHQIYCHSIHLHIRSSKQGLIIYDLNIV